MKIIDTPKYLLVGNLPEGARSFLIYKSILSFEHEIIETKGARTGVIGEIPLPPGSYGQPILASGMGWELKREIVEDDEGWYPDFVNEGMTYLSSHDSFESLLSSHNLQPSTTVVIPKTLTHA